jgi:hypothetical protein
MGLYGNAMQKGSREYNISKKNLKLPVGGYQGSGADIILRSEMDDLLQRFVILLNNIQCEY